MTQVASKKGLHRVVIIGGGFGGLQLAKQLRRSPVQVTLIDRKNYHLFQPLLYQVATSALSPANIASPLRSLLRRQANASVLLGEVIDFDVQQRRVLLKDRSVDYDTLVVAAGATNSYFGKDHWSNHAPGLKTIEEATKIRGLILSAFEQAEQESDATIRQAWLTFVIIGGGPTGVELSGALAEIAHSTFKKDFRNIRPSDARVVLVEASDRILGSFTEKLSAAAQRDLARLGVEVLVGTRVIDITEKSLAIEHEGVQKTIESHTILWGAGVKASPLAALLAAQTQGKLDRQGRIEVDSRLSLPGHSEILVLGDMAHFETEDKKVLPGVAPVAIQQGWYAAKLIAAKVSGKKFDAIFKYVDRGSMAVVGRGSAVAMLGKYELTGVLGWIGWLVIHLLLLVQLQNRLLVLMQWSWSFFTFQRSARLITNNPREPK